MNFKKKDIEQMSAAVKEAEKFTSGEIVPVFSPRSSDYSRVSYYLAVFGFCISSIILYFFHSWYPFLMEMSAVIALQVAGLFLGHSLGKIPLLIRLLTKKSEFAKKVHERAMIEFFQLGLQETKHRTGVLIYVSFLERRVEILADKGIHEKLGQNYWDSEIKQIVSGIKAHDPGKSFSDSILRIGKKLQEHFPRGNDDKNELNDTVQMR